MTKSLSEWRQQLERDKDLYDQAKSPHGNIQTGYKTVNGKKVPLYAVEYYGKLYRESLAGYRRALQRQRRSR